MEGAVLYLAQMEHVETVPGREFGGSVGPVLVIMGAAHAVVVTANSVLGRSMEARHILESLPWFGAGKGPF